MKHLFITLLLISAIFSQQTIAVLDFEGIGVSQEEARALSNRFGSEFLELAEYKFTLVERQAMGEILKEQGLQQSGCVSSECAVEVGAALGAELIIIGSISKVGSIFSVNARMLDVETSRILKSINYDQVGDIGLLLTKGMREAAAKLLNVVVKPAAPSIGTVSFTSEYQGVDISVDGEKIGSVPLLKTYAVGIYKFSAFKLNYETYKGEFEIKFNVTTIVDIKFKTTSLTITGLDGTKIRGNVKVGLKSINDIVVGTIKSGELKVDNLGRGTYTFIANAPGHKQKIKNLYIDNLSKKYNLDMTLEKRITEVVFLNYRPNQTLYIRDDKDQHLKTLFSNSIELDEGKYKIKITEPGFENIEVELDRKSYRQTFKIPNSIPIKVPVTFELKPRNAKVVIRKRSFFYRLATDYGSGPAFRSYSDIIFEHDKPQNLIFGDYSFLATAPKHLSKNINVIIDTPEAKTSLVNLEPKKRIRALTYSTLLPGSGQFYSENKTKSAIFLLASAGLSALFYNNYDTYNVEESLVSQYEENYLNATDPDEIDQNFNTYQSQVNTVNDLQTQMMMYGGALAVTWVVNLIDAYFFSGLLE